MATAVFPVPRLIAGRLSPISLGPSPRWLVSPRPSRPSALYPQHLTLPPFRSAHVWRQPVEIATAVLPVPRLIAGRLSPISSRSSPRWLVSPRPSRPSVLYPQHLMLPSWRSAQL